MKLPSDCYISKKDFTLNESAFSNWETTHQKYSGQLHSKRQEGKFLYLFNGDCHQIKSLQRATSSSQQSCSRAIQASHPLSAFHSSSEVWVSCPHQKVRHWKSLKKNRTKLRQSEQGLAERHIPNCKEDSTPLKTPFPEWDLSQWRAGLSDQLSCQVWRSLPQGPRSKKQTEIRNNCKVARTDKNRWGTLQKHLEQIPNGRLWCPRRD